VRSRPKGGGEELWALVKSSPVFDEHGHARFVVTVFKDFTEHRRSEDAVKKAVLVRDQFLSIASHELKTPITALSLQIQIAKQKLRQTAAGLSTEQLGKLLDISGRQIDRLSRLVEDLLDVSRIQAGKLTFVAKR